MTKKIDEEDLKEVSGGHVLAHDADSVKAREHKGSRVDQYQVQVGVKYVFEYTKPGYDDDYNCALIGVPTRVYEASYMCGEFSKRAAEVQKEDGTIVTLGINQGNVYEYIE